MYGFSTVHFITAYYYRDGIGADTQAYLKNGNSPSCGGCSVSGTPGTRTALPTRGVGSVLSLPYLAERHRVAPLSHKRIAEQLCDVQPSSARTTSRPRHESARHCEFPGVPRTEHPITRRTVSTYKAFADTRRVDGTRSVLAPLRAACGSWAW